MVKQYVSHSHSYTDTIIGQPYTDKSAFVETIFPKVLKKKKNLPNKILYLANLPFRNEEKKQPLPDKRRLREFITTRADFKKIRKGFFKLK